MKFLFVSLFFFLSLLSTAQSKYYDLAVISTTTNVISPEEEDVQNLQNNQESSRGGMNFRNMLDGETKFVTYLKNDLIKTVIKSEMGRSTIYRDNLNKSTTSIMEMMGSKNGFFVTDDEQGLIQKERDSMMAERRKKDTTSRRYIENDKKNYTTEISYTNESKKIASYDCKKAFVITSKLLGIKDTAIIWYTTELKFKNLLSTGNFNILPGMMGSMSPTLYGLDKIDGFVMRYELNMRRNKRMEVEVTKVELDKVIDDKEFNIPTNIEIKPMSEMQNMFGGGRGNYMRSGRD